MGLTVGGRIHRLPYPHPQYPYFAVDKLVKIAHLLSLMVPPFRDDDQAGFVGDLGLRWSGSLQCSSDTERYERSSPPQVKYPLLGGGHAMKDAQKQSRFLFRLQRLLPSRTRPPLLLGINEDTLEFSDATF
jgi:hypothetical protein